MKTQTMILGVLVLLAAGLNAQSNGESIASLHKELAVDGSSTIYYAENSDYYVDEDGVISSKLVSFHENGAIEEQGVLLKGKKDGKWLRFNAAGVLVNEAHYKQNVKNGSWKVWDENGTLRLEFNYKAGNRSGKWYMYDENGKQIKAETY